MRGYDAGKKVNGRKRHILVDTLGLLLVVLVHPAHWQDRDAARLVLAMARRRFERLCLIWADAGYAGRLAMRVAEILRWVREIKKTSHTGGWRCTVHLRVARAIAPARAKDYEAQTALARP